MDVGSAIRSRRTHKRYGSEPLDEPTLSELLELARHGPNHHLTEPWRFRVLGPETRARLEECCGETEALKLRRAPTLVVATAALSGDLQTDEEDLHAVACAVYAVLLGATERGLASYWRTPEAFGRADVRHILRLGPNEKFVGLIHLGPSVSEPPQKERTPLGEVVQFMP